MVRHEEEVKPCEFCGALEATTMCDGCGKRLCKKCRSMEIYGSKDLEVLIKSYCLACSTNPDTHPAIAKENVLGLERITDMVNQDVQKTKGFKIRLKME